MLMSFSHLPQDPQHPLFTSTPKKTISTTEDIIPLTNHSNTNGGTTSPSEGSGTHRSKSCPTSPVINYLERSEVTDAEDYNISSVEEKASENKRQVSDVQLTTDMCTEGQKTNHTIVGNKRKADVQNNQLKQRLLNALAQMIPHRERLSLRLLVNYTIDDVKTDCIVIDETLSRSNGANLSDSGCVPDQESETGTGKRRRSSKDSNALDLSVHMEREDQELEEAMNTEPDDNSVSPPRKLTTNTIVKINGTASDTRLGNPNGNCFTTNPLLIPGMTNGHGPTVFPCGGLPFLDSSVLTLLPLLQQQQQQQQQHLSQAQNTTRLFELPKLIPNNEHASTGTAANAETAESILFKELQSLMRTTHNETINNFTINKSSTTLSSPTSTNFINPAVSSQPLVGLPLMNNITPEQLSTLQALLPSYPFLSNTTPHFGSLNITPSALLNFKDTSSENAGMIPTNKPLINPVANLLGQLTAPQANNFSLRSMNNLSQFFNCSEASSLKTHASDLSQVSGITINNQTITEAMSGLNDHKSRDLKIDDPNPPNVTLTMHDPTQNSYGQSERSCMNGIGNNNNNNLSYSGNQFIFGRRLTHTRRFICNQCRKNFSSLAELNRHTLEAHNSFKCTICSAHFTQRSNLQRHSLKHVGFKPFTCNLCKKEYYRKDHLVRHIEVTHPNHDPKMNITVHLTSSECLDYLDRLHAEKQSPSSDDAGLPDGGLTPQVQETAELPNEDTSSYKIEGETATAAAVEEVVEKMEQDEPIPEQSPEPGVSFSNL